MLSFNPFPADSKHPLFLPFYNLLLAYAVLSKRESKVSAPPLDNDITGTISEIKWYPQKTIKGIPGMSGSAGYDRIMPAHFIIKLTNYLKLPLEKGGFSLIPSF